MKADQPTTTDHDLLEQMASSLATIKLILQVWFLLGCIAAVVLIAQAQSSDGGF